MSIHERHFTLCLAPRVHSNIKNIKRNSRTENIPDLWPDRRDSEQAPGPRRESVRAASPVSRGRGPTVGTWRSEVSSQSASDPRKA
eukprot:1297640-Prymnesium_polylepis.1